MVKKISERKLLKLIIKNHYSDFINNIEENRDIISRQHYYINIDLVNISKKLKMNEEVVRGFLFFYINEKYSYYRNGNMIIPFYKTSSEVDLINFSLLSAVISELDNKNLKEGISLILSLIAIVVAAITALY